MSPTTRLTSLGLAALLLGGCAGGPGPDRPGPPAPGERGGRAGPDAPRSLSPAEEAALRVDTVAVEPGRLQLRVGDTASLRVAALDSAGAEVGAARVERFVRGAAARWDDEAGRIRAVEPGEATFYAVVTKPAGRRDPERVVARVPVEVSPLPVVGLELIPPEGPVYAGTRVRIGATARSEMRPRPDADLRWSSSDPSVATVSPHGLLQAVAPGRVSVAATAGRVADSVDVRVVENPVREVGLEGPEGPLTVGRVARFRARALDGSGRPVPDVPVEWTVSGPRGGMTGGAYVDGDGILVAEAPGLFRLTATVGSRSATREVEARPGARRRAMQVVGHGAVEGRATSDLWVFEGVDGRDYAYTGTRAAGAAGNVMYAWDVTEPSEPTLTDSVVVDARVVNDIKVNETRNLAVITREGASDRKNGIVLLDIRTPAHPRILSRYTETLGGGVHDTWIEGDLVYAVHTGTGALHIIDISDPESPVQAGRWQLGEEDRHLHDVTIRDGLAYLGYWNHGLVILDVGRGVAGGSATEPELVSRYAYETGYGPGAYGNTHHAVRHGDHVFVGEVVFGCHECVDGPRGYVHVMDVSDLENPREVARYRVPEAGAQRPWVQDDRLYVAYRGGLRVVDISGELRGDLYRQGREVGRLETGPRGAPGDAPAQPAAFRPDATMAGGPRLHEGRVFVSDVSSGLWILDFADEAAEGTD